MGDGGYEVVFFVQGWVGWSVAGLLYLCRGLGGWCYGVVCYSVLCGVLSFDDWSLEVMFSLSLLEAIQLLKRWWW